MEYFDYPKDKQVSPFDINNINEYFFEAGNKISYLTDYEDVDRIIGSYKESEKIFPWYESSFVLCAMKRYAIVENGMIIYINESFKDGHTIGRGGLGKAKKYIICTNVTKNYYIDSWGKHELQSNIIREEKLGYNCSLEYRLFSTPEYAVKYAIEISKENPMKCIVAQWFAEIDRY